MCYQITTVTLARHVNAVRFTSDGSRVSWKAAAAVLQTVDDGRFVADIGRNDSTAFGSGRRGKGSATFSLR